MDTEIDVVPGWSLWLSLSSQWDFLFEGIKGWNWIVFTPIAIEFEYGTYKGKYFEFAFTLMGFTLRAELYNKKDRSSFISKMDEMVGDLLKKEEKLP